MFCNAEYIILKKGIKMKLLNNEDEEVVRMAREVIVSNYDNVNINHTVGAAVRGKSGKIYIGINVYSIHGACAEQVALGNAIAHGEREFVIIVAVRGKDGKEVIPPCGNCRQILSDYAPNCEVIISKENNTLGKVLAKEL